MSELKTGPTKYDAWAYLFIGLLVIPIAALGVGALVLPPGISYQLVVRGLAEGRPSWTALGGLCALLWLGGLFALGRRVMSGRASAAAEGAGDRPGRADDVGR